MSSCTIISQNLKKETIESFFEIFRDSRENSWFLAIGNPIPWSFDKEIANTKVIYDKDVIGNDSIVPISLDTEREKFNFYKTCTAMKRISSDDISFIIPRNKWEQNTFYYPYRDDRDLFSQENIVDRPFYVYNENNRCVYKCIENDFYGASADETDLGRSLYPPTGTNSEIIDTNDGYKWKFMYELDSADEFKFFIRGRNERDTYIPVKYIDYDPSSSNQIEQKQKNVQDSAVDGSISSIYVNENYRNLFKLDQTKCIIGSVEPAYTETSYNEGVTEIDITYYGENTEINSIKDLFLYVIDGDGKGQVRLIKESERVKISDSYYLRITIDPLDEGLRPFGSGSNTSVINILPAIEIFGDGEANDPDAAFNSSLKTALSIPFFDDDNFLRGVDLLDIGKNYTFAKATISKGLTRTDEPENLEIPEDLLKTSMAPFGGHGSNPVVELGASRIVSKINLEGSEENQINASNDFRQIAIIKNPQFTDTAAIVRTAGNVGSGIAINDSVELSGSGISANGIVKNIYEYGGSIGREFIIKEISGDIGNYTTIDGDAIDGNDGLIFIDYAGLENKNVTKLVSKENITNISPRDIILGVGNKSLGLGPSFASGKIISIVNGRDVSVENPRGIFKINEKVYAFGVDGTQKGTFEINNFEESTPTTFKTTYNMTTKLNIESSLNDKFDINSFAADNLVYSFEDDSNNNPTSSSNFKSNAFVFDWTINSSNPSDTTNTGVLEVVGAKKGTFEVGDYILYYKDNIARYATINSIVLPEIRYGSGEVLYVQNFTGIERFGGNEEQINLVLGL